MKRKYCSRRQAHWTPKYGICCANGWFRHSWRSQYCRVAKFQDCRAYSAEQRGEEMFKKCRGRGDIPLKTMRTMPVRPQTVWRLAFFSAKCSLTTTKPKNWYRDSFEPPILAQQERDKRQFSHGTLQDITYEKAAALSTQHWPATRACARHIYTGNVLMHPE